jgi:hypothetical protein
MLYSITASFAFGDFSNLHFYTGDVRQQPAWLTLRTVRVIVPVHSKEHLSMRCRLRLIHRDKNCRVCTGYLSALTTSPSLTQRR